MDKRAEVAPCGQTDPELWFPAKGANVNIPRRLCRTCPFLAACRTWALDHPHETEFGMWGGLTARERERVLRDRRRSPASPALDESMREAA